MVIIIYSSGTLYIMLHYILLTFIGERVVLSLLNPAGSHSLLSAVGDIGLLPHQSGHPPISSIPHSNVWYHQMI